MTSRPTRPQLFRSAAVLGMALALVVGVSTVPADAVATGTATSVSLSKSSFDKSMKSRTNPKSDWVIVNKRNHLHPVTYVPSDLVSVPVPHVYAPQLRKKASAAVVKMFAAYTKQTGKSMQSQSAYRSYTAQKSVYNGYVSRIGKKRADLTSARPGYSEHQSGLAIDISAKPARCTLSACFAETSQGKWLAKNAWKYGFVLRYPKGKTSVTGYEFEPWHYRYVNKGLAAEMHRTGKKTLEGFFGLPKAPGYK